MDNFKVFINTKIKECDLKLIEMAKEFNSSSKDKTLLTLEEIKSKKAELLLKMKELSALSSRHSTLKEVLEEYSKSQQ